MTRDEATTQIRRQLGFRTDLGDTIEDAIRLAQQQLELEPEPPWFLLTENASLVTTADSPFVAIPTNMLEEDDDDFMKYIPSDPDEAPVFLRKDELDVLTENFKTTDNGAPQAYALHGSYFVIFPTPDDVYTLSKYTFQPDTILTSDVENQWLKYAPMLLMGKAGQIVANSVRDKDAYAQFQSWEKQGRLAVFARNESRKWANTQLQMGGPH